MDVWDAINGAAVLQLKGHQADVTSVGYSPDGQALYAIESRLSTPKQIYFVNRLARQDEHGCVRAGFDADIAAGSAEQHKLAFARDFSCVDAHRAAQDDQRRRMTFR